MPILGLKTVLVSPPHDPDTTFRVRTELSPHQILVARKQISYQAMAHMAEASGPGAVNDIIEALREGRSPEDIEAELNEGPRRLGPGDRTDVEVGTGVPPEDEEAGEIEWEEYDMDYLGAELVKSWSYKDPRGHRVPVKVRYVRRLDALTREWVHGLVRDAALDAIGVTATEGNA